MKMLCNLEEMVVVYQNKRGSLLDGWMLDLPEKENTEGEKVPGEQFLIDL